MKSNLIKALKREYLSAAGPKYKRVSASIASLVEAGGLRPGDGVPSQRELAEAFGIDFTTVTKGYDEARALGLISAEAGRGTFVSLAGTGRSAGPTAIVDLSSIWPPNQQLIHTLASNSRALLEQKAFSFLAQRRPGTVVDMEAGEKWLRHTLLAPIRGRIAIASGVRNALAALLSVLDLPEKTLLIEQASWPTLRFVAQQCGVRCVPVSMDSEGIRPDDLERAVRASGSRALYCVPTLQNPTSITMPLARRQALVTLARKLGIVIIEDEVYGPLLSSRPPALYDLAPERVFLLAGLSKCISPSLRVAYVACPDAGFAVRLQQALSLSMQAPSPFESMLAGTMILSGASGEYVVALREENRVRQSIALRSLGQFSPRWHQEGMCVLAPLPPGHTESGLLNTLESHGIKLAAGSSFGEALPPSVRIATGAVTRDQLAHACDVIKSVLDKAPQGQADLMA